MTVSSGSWKMLEERYLLPTYTKLPISIERGKGCYVYDVDGIEYLDMYSGHCVASTGHCHPEVVGAIQNQAAQLIFYSNATYNSTRAGAVSNLLKICGSEYYQAFLVNSGAEANDNAIKLARALTGRKEIISTENAFHGRTYGGLSATGIEQYRNYLNTPVPHHRVCHFEEVETNISEKTAGVLIEPIQSMGGVIEIPAEILQSIELGCRKKGAILIFDEIQTGVGRTGSFLYSQQAGVLPDITTLAKGIASGYPAGAVLLTEKQAKQVKRGDLGSTFGGNPLACAAIEATLKVIDSEKLVKNAAAVGDYLAERLRQMSRIEEVRGRGLLLGLKFRSEGAKEVQQALMQKRVLTGGSSDPRVLRLMPALTLGEEDVNRFLEALESV